MTVASSLAAVGAAVALMAAVVSLAPGAAKYHNLRYLSVTWKACFALAGIAALLEKAFLSRRKQPGNRFLVYNGRSLRGQSLNTLHHLTAKSKMGVTVKRHRITVSTPGHGTDHDVQAIITVPSAGSDLVNINTAILFAHAWRHGLPAGNMEDALMTKLAEFFSFMGFVTCRFNFVGSLASRGESDVVDCAAVAQYLAGMDLHAAQVDSAESPAEHKTKEEEETQAAGRVTDAMDTAVAEGTTAAGESAPAAGAARKNKGKGKEKAEQPTRQIKNIVVVGQGYGGIIGSAAARLMPDICGHVQISPPLETLATMVFGNHNKLLDASARLKPKLHLAGSNDLLFTTRAFARHIATHSESASAGALVLGTGGDWKGHAASLSGLILEWLPCTGCGYVGVKGRDGAVVTKAELDKAAAAAAGGSGARKNQAAKSSKKKKGAKKAK